MATVLKTKIIEGDDAEQLKIEVDDFLATITVGNLKYVTSCFRSDRMFITIIYTVIT